MLVTATVGQEELARAVTAAAYRRGAEFVDVFYYDPWVKRARIEGAAEDTLDYVPPWFRQRLLDAAERRSARMAFAGIVAPDALEGLDGARLGRDLLPWVKEAMGVINDRSTNWCIVPCPHPDWAEMVYPGLDPDEAYERLWAQLWHILRLDEADPVAAWDERVAGLEGVGRAAQRPPLRRARAQRPGNRAHDRAAPVIALAGRRLRDGRRYPPPAEPPVGRGLQRARPAAGRRPRDLDEAARPQGRRDRHGASRAVRGRPGGPGRRRRERRGDQGEGRASTKAPPGSARLRSSTVRAGSGRRRRSSSTRCSTRTPRATSRSAARTGSPPRTRTTALASTQSAIHIDFMIGSSELEVTGVTLDGERVPVMRGGDWQL